MSQSPFKRRMFLRGLGGAALGLPFLDSLARTSSTAQAQTSEFPKRLIFLVTNNGTNPETHWPTGNGSDFSLGPIMAPLQTYKNNMVVLRGVDNQAAMATRFNGHADAIRCMLTGRTATRGPDGQFVRDEATGGGISIDQFVAQQIGETSVVQSLEYEQSYQYDKPTNYVSFYGQNSPVPFEDEADKLFRRVFGEREVDVSDADRLARVADQRSVLDAVLAQYGQLQRRVSSADRRRLARHADTLRSLERRLGAGAAAICVPPSQPTDKRDWEAGLDVVAHAFACDLTRVATVKLRQDSSGLGVVGSYHDDYLHHVTRDPEAARIVTAVKTRLSQRVAEFIERLRNLPEGEGSVFDNTLVVWADEFCHGYQHRHHEVPYVLLSGSNRFTEMGRYIHYTAPVSNNRLWLSIRDMLGASGDFGDPEFGSTPLAELEAA